MGGEVQLLAIEIISETMEYDLEEIKKKKKEMARNVKDW